MKRIRYLLYCLPLLFHAQHSVSEAILLENDGITLSGTLQYPETGQSMPLVIFVHGSGLIDRDGNTRATTLRPNYIKTLSDSLTSRELGFFRYDKRTAVPGNPVTNATVTLNDFVSDVQKIVSRFENDTRFSSINLVGHSQGSLVALLALTPAVNRYVSIAGPATTIDQVITAQLTAQHKDAGLAAAGYFEELKRTDTIQEVSPFLNTIFHPSLHKFLLHWMQYDPILEIEKIALPILIVNGNQDLQVPPAAAQALHKAAPHAELAIIEQMNHVLKDVHSLSYNYSAYTDAGYPLSPELIRVLLKFLNP